jgi:hypothetical protein
LLGGAIIHVDIRENAPESPFGTPTAKEPEKNRKNRVIGRFLMLTFPIGTIGSVKIRIFPKLKYKEQNILMKVSNLPQL